jgi:rhodanese-related sulfurtransferase
MLNFLRSSAPSGNRVGRIAPQEAVRMAEAGELIVIDVRDGMELRASGKAAGALHVPLMAFRMKCDPTSPECLPELKQGKPIALYCASGARSAGAAQMLLQLGHGTVYNLGGLYDWHAGGGKIER